MYYQISRNVSRRHQDFSPPQRRVVVSIAVRKYVFNGRPNVFHETGYCHAWQETLVTLTVTVTEALVLRPY